MTSRYAVAHESVSIGPSVAATTDRAVHLSSTGDHVFNIVGVPRAVYVCVVTGRGVVFNEKC